MSRLIRHSTPVSPDRVSQSRDCLSYRYLLRRAIARVARMGRRFSIHSASFATFLGDLIGAVSLVLFLFTALILGGDAP